MANVKITDLSLYTGGTSSDVLPIVNVSGNITEQISRQTLYDLYSAATTTSNIFVNPKDINQNITIGANTEVNGFVFGSGVTIDPGSTITVEPGSTLYFFDPDEYKLNNNIFTGVNEYTDNADAISNGLVVGQIYRTGDFIKIVH